MKVPHVIAEFVSEFSGFQHTPDFKASRSTGNFEEESEEGTSSHHPEHHSDEHHGHSLYFGKHFGKKHLAPVAEKESDTASTHSGGSGHSGSKGKHHGLSVHFKDFFHIGHHHHHKHDDDGSKVNSGASTPARKNSTGSQCACQKHSINITVGADEVPTVLATPPNELNSHVHYVKNTQSPCISRVVSSSSLKEKLNKIKRTTSSDSEADFPEKKCSVASYRVVTH
uniref:Zgc: n=1 Tax=Caenorhabditis tropicalis TaxID=1561998 RepID=A0A1I7T4X2_9PELO